MRHPQNDHKAQRLADQLKSEILQDLAAYNAYIAQHGSPAELARFYYVAQPTALLDDSV